MFIHMGESGAASKARFWRYMSRTGSTDTPGSACCVFGGAGTGTRRVSAQPRGHDGCLYAGGVVRGRDELYLDK